jgi:hypothetical protein
MSYMFYINIIMDLIFFVCVLMLCTQVKMFLDVALKTHIGIEGTRLTSEIPCTRTDLAL